MNRFSVAPTVHGGRPLHAHNQHRASPGEGRPTSDGRQSKHAGVWSCGSGAFPARREGNQSAHVSLPENILDLGRAAARCAVIVSNCAGRTQTHRRRVGMAPAGNRKSRWGRTRGSSGPLMERARPPGHPAGLLSPPSPQIKCTTCSTLGSSGELPKNSHLSLQNKGPPTVS